MTYAVRFTPEARDQIDALEAYIAGAASPEIAARYIDAVVDYCAGLRITNYRHSTIIAFRVDAMARTVSIIGVSHGGRDIERAMAPDD